jgi:site-specific DNA recombinase
MKIAIYSRKSKFTGKGDSIENQVQMCKDYALSHLNNTSLEFDVYEDEGYTGSNINRPEFQSLIKNIKEYDMLICYRLDRISRNVADFSSTLQLLQSNNCDFVSIREQFDTTSPMGRAMIYIASVFAQLERETIAERIKDNMLEMAKNGHWTGGRTPLGYDSEVITYIDNEGNERKSVKLIKNEKELELVKLIYQTYLNEGSLHKTETWFTQNNIKSNGGILLEKTSLKIILQNPVYVKSTPEVLEYMKNHEWNVYGEADGVHGLLSYNKTESITLNGKLTKRNKPKSEWIAALSSCEGVIDANTWLAVQEQFNRNKESFPRLGKTHNAILVGKLKCSCGNPMIIHHGRISKKTGNKLFYYICSMKKRSKGTICNSNNLKAAEIEEGTISVLESLAKNKLAFLKKLKEENKKNTENENKKITLLNLQKQINDKKKQIDNLVNKLSIDDSISDILIIKIKELKIEVTKLEESYKDLEYNITEIKNEEFNISFIESVLNRCYDIRSYSKEEQKQLVNVLVDDIIYDSDTNDIEINIIGSKKK